MSRQNGKRTEQLADTMSYLLEKADAVPGQAISCAFGGADETRVYEFKLVGIS